MKTNCGNVLECRRLRVWRQFKVIERMREEKDEDDGKFLWLVYKVVYSAQSSTNYDKFIGATLTENVLAPLLI